MGGMEEDIRLARQAIREAKRIAGQVKGKISGRMDPEAPTWDVARDLANAAESVAYHATWMTNALEKQEGLR